MFEVGHLGSRTTTGKRGESRADDEEEEEEKEEEEEEEEAPTGRAMMS